MKKILLLTILMFLLGRINSQCLQIEGILVDACNSGGLNEPYNEMVRFKSGITAIPISQISVAGKGNTGGFSLNKWPNLTQLWHGLVQNTNTASKVSAINSSILACGFVKEPPAGLIPPNAEVIMVTSQYMTPTSNSFANLNDTIYMVFQDTVSNSTAGHFANWNSVPSNRSLILFDNLSGCSDTVTYDISLLPLHGNGDGVDYDIAGNPTYINRGCQAPYIPLSVDGGPDQNSCQQASVTINATSTGNYSSVAWTGGTGNFAPGNALSTVYTPAANETGTIKLIVTLSSVCGITVKDSLNINITAFPVAAISSSPGNTICQNQSATLTGSGGGTSYSWQLPGNIAGPLTATLSATSQGTYTLTATNSCASDTETFFLTVNPLPVVSVTPSGATTFCIGGSVDLTASGATSYSWTNPSSTNNPVTVNASGFYWVTGTNSCGTDTAGINVAVIPTPTVSASSSAPVFCSGSSVTFTSSTQAGNTISWTPAGTNPANITAGGTYTVTATAPNSCGTATASVSVTMENPMTLSISAAPNDTICQGNSATLTAGGGGTYSWSAGAPNNITAAGTYSVTSSNSCGTFSASTDIAVLQAPTVTVTSSAGTSLCSGVSTTLTASGGSSYYWLPGAITGNTLTTSSAGTYSVGSGNYCGSDTATITLSVTNTPNVTISASGPVSFCPGGSVDLTAGGGTTYTWNNSLTNQTITVNSPGFYWVTGTSSCGTDSAGVTVTILPVPTVNLNQASATICSGDSSLVIATTTGNPVLSWSPVSSSNDSVYVLTAGTYTVDATNSCGTVTSNFTLSLDNPLNLSINTSPNDTICQGSTATLTASGGSSYTWSTGSSLSVINTSNAGNFSVSSTNACGTYSASASVVILQTPSVSVSASATTLCGGQTSVLTATVTGQGNFLWSTGSSTNPVTVNAAGNYSATISNLCGTGTSNVIVITASATPTASITPSSIILCPGDTAILSASGNGSYSWSTGASASTIGVSNAGTYTLTVTNSCGTATTSVAIAASTVTAQFNASPSSGIYPLPVTFTNGSTNANSYLWDFGNGDTSSTVAPAEVYSAPGTYTVTLAATNSDGCTDIETATITVLEHESFILIPNVFTPNGDSLNESLAVSYFGISSFNLVIYDRWGLELFSSDSLGESWDGKTSSGEKCSEGTYYYLVKAEGIDGKKLEVKGFVLLVR